MPVMKKRFLVSGLVTAASAAGLAASPTAAADCTSSGGITICAQGNVTGPSGVPTSSSPYYPYPCDDDWLCDDGGVSLVIDPGPPNGGIDIGLPGRPGNRPGR
jgi:hypothetical protein